MPHPSELPAAPSDRHFSRVGAIAAFAGLVVYTGAALLHPGPAPHDTQRAFAEYAREPLWGAIHLLELLGILLMCVTALALAWRLRRGAAGVWAALAAAAILVFGAVYAVFTAVDGVGLGVLVRRLAETGAAGGVGTVAGTEVIFEAAYAVRQVEAGLFALQWFVFGLATALFAPAFLAAPIPRGRSRAMAALSALAALGTLAFGVVQAQTGFSATSMAFQPGLYLAVLWVIAAGVFLARSPS